MGDRSHLFDGILKYLNMNRLSRAHRHYCAIREDLAQRTQKEREEAVFFSRKFERYHRRAQRLLTIRLLISPIVYATILVSLLQVFPLLRVLGTMLIGLNATLGAIGFGIMILLSIRINLQLQLMNQCLMHLVALYQANPRRDTERVLKALRRTL